MISEQGRRARPTRSAGPASSKPLDQQPAIPARIAPAGVENESHHNVQSLSNYIRVFCQESKGRFLLQDIEQLLRDPVFIRQAQHDPAHQERCHLVEALLSYFKANRTSPLYWFDVITGWKGGHARGMPYEEFAAGFQRYCEDIRCPTWEEVHLKQVFTAMLRGQGISSGSRVLGRQDFRFAMKRSSLSHRKVLWLNAQASILTQIQCFLHSIRAQFSDFCPAQVLRQQGKTITLHELESMLYKLLADLDTFHVCPHAKEMAAEHARRVDEWRRHVGVSRSSNTTPLVEGSVEDDIASYGSVGSLVRQERFRGNVDLHSPSSPRQFARKASAKASLFRPASEQKIKKVALLPRVASARQPSKKMPVLVFSESSDNDSTSTASSDSRAAALAARQRRLEEQKRREEQDLKARRVTVEQHIAQFLKPDEMRYLYTMVGAMRQTKPASAPQMQPRKSIRLAVPIATESPQARTDRLVKRHSIIAGYSPTRGTRAAVEEVDDDADLRSLDSVFQDELASFEQILSTKKAKHIKAYDDVTQQFNRRVNLAKSRLSQIHR